MPLAIYTSAAWTANGGITPAGGASVEVRSETGSETAGQLVSLSSDRDGANGLNNPFTADAQGRFAFFVAGGAYRVTVTDSDGNSHTLRYQAIGTAGEMDTEDVIALANEGVFDSTADGIVATTDGAFFWVPDSPDEVILYTNVAGSAEEQLRIPTSVFVREVRQDAEDARDAAQSAGNLFSDTAAGLAATNDGDYFSVVGASAFELYLNDAGSAVLQFTYGGPQGTAPGEIPTNADLPNSSSVGNASGDIPISNGTVNTNLNADLLDGSSVGTAPGEIPTNADVLTVPASSSDPGLALDTWRTPNASRATLVSVSARLFSTDTQQALVLVEVDESGGTTRDYSHTLADARPGEPPDQNTVTFLVPPGASYQLRNEGNPNGTNSTLGHREFTL